MSHLYFCSSPREALGRPDGNKATKKDGSMNGGGGLGGHCDIGDEKRGFRCQISDNFVILAAFTGNVVRQIIQHFCFA